MQNQEANEPNPEPKSVPSHSIGNVLDAFVKQIDGLAETLPLAIRVIQDLRTDARQNLNEFVLRECKFDADEKFYTIEAGKIFEHDRLQGRLRRIQVANQLIPRSFLVSLVSQFDALLGGLIRELFILKPEILNSSENTLTFSQMVEFGSINAAREFIIDKEIETVLRKSHSDQFDWLENKFGLPLRKGLDSWSVFIEVTERRNLFVHANGIVSHQYMETCARHSCQLDPGTQLGARLRVDRQYFDSAHDCILEIGVKLAQVLWRKLKSDDPADLGQADKSLITICYELLAEGRYGIARRLLDFGVETIKKHSAESSRLVLVINRAQAYKWMGEEETARKIVNAEDWSAVEPRFRLARAVLLDDLDECIKVMKLIGADKQLGALAYREWPLFRAVRKTAKFAEAFEVIFGEPLHRMTKIESPPDETVH